MKNRERLKRANAITAPVDGGPRVRAIICAGLFAGTWLIFSRALGNDFVNYDDPDYVTANAHVLSGLTWDSLRWAFRSGEASNWHPLTWLSHQLDVSLFGMNPRGHHATSVLLHAVNAVLAFLALRRLTGALWTSALGAALFAWHPLRVESVAWIAERKDVLSGCAWFGVLWAYAVYAERRRDGRGGAGWYYGMALVAFVLGLMSKPMLVTLPCVLLLLDFWPLRRLAFARGDPSKRESCGALMLEKLPFFGFAAASSVITYLVQKGGGSVTSALSLDLRLGNAVVAVARYIGKAFWPFDLAVLYPHPGAWPIHKVVASAVLVAGISAVAMWQWRRRPWITVGWLWFLGTLVPVIGLVQVGLQSMADRYTYLPMVGLQVALLWTAREWFVSPGARRIAGAVAAAVLTGCALRSADQLRHWRNSFTLFDQAIAVTDKNYVAHDNRGLFLFKAGKVVEAMADYRRALAINPAYLNANNNLGYSLAQLGRPAEAVPAYRAALAANPGHIEVRNNLANALSDLGQLAEAMEHYDFVLQRQPGHVNALNGSAVVLAMQNRLPEAKARLEASLRIAPSNASAHNNLGNVCSMLGLRDEAIAHYRRAAELNAGDPHPWMLIGTLQLQADRFAEAAESFQHAIERRPNFPDAHAHRGLALYRIGRREEAIRALRTALQQNPEHAQAKSWLAAIEAATPR